MRDDALAHRRSLYDQGCAQHADIDHTHALAINACTLCDDDGYTPALRVCDHVDYREIARRGRRLVNEAMQWK